MKIFVIGNKHPWKREKFLGYSTMKSMRAAVMKGMSPLTNLHSQKLSCWMVTITLRMTPAWVKTWMWTGGMWHSVRTMLTVHCVESFMTLNYENGSLTLGNISIFLICQSPSPSRLISDIASYMNSSHWPLPSLTINSTDAYLVS